jgi:hypothetical protein
MTNLFQPRPDALPGPAPPSRRSLLAILEGGMLVVLIAAGLIAWGVGIVHRGYDYDEVQRAHSVWLASRGLRPYADMFEVHPPYFILLTPVFRYWADPCDALRALRIFSAVGNLAFLGGLVALGWSTRPRGGRWAWLGVAFVAFHPKVLDFLVEFRIDGWGYALAAWSLVVFLRRPEARLRFATFGAWSGIATLLFNPKLAILPPLIVGMALIRERPSRREALRASASYALGLGIAGLFFALYLAVNRIALDRTYYLLFRYHTLSNARSAHRNGLMRQIFETPLLLAPIVLGAVAWTLDLLKKKSPSDVYIPAMGLWLVIQALLVAYQYKQYYAPWFLFASIFVIVLGRSLDSLWRPLGASAFLAACLVSVVAAVGIAQLWERYSPARSHCALIRALNVVAGPDDRVVAPPPDHPISRRDVFFLWFNTSDPDGYDSERILSGLGPYPALVSPEQNRATLRAHPPAFVILDAGPFAAAYPEGQWNALLDFLPRQGYRVVRMKGLRLALRPDRYERLRGEGFFEDDAGPPGPVMPRAR